MAGPGAALPYRDTIQHLFGRHDVTGVRAHSDPAAQDASTALGAKAYAFGNHVAFAGTPDLHTAAHEAAHVVQQRQGVQLKDGVGQAGDAYERHADAVADRVVAGQSAEALLGEMAPASPAPSPGPGAVQRREINPDGEYDRDTNAQASMTAADWLTSDRVGNTAVWQQACLTNLLSADVTQYRQIVERRDFYLWFYNTTAAMGCETRWALAAYVVANGAHQVADMDNEALNSIANTIGNNLAGVELQGAMRDGNEAIFNNVLPKLRDLYNHAVTAGPIVGQAALQWDMQTLAEEQALIQPLYNTMSQQARDQMTEIAHQWGFYMTVGTNVFHANNVNGSQYIKPGAVPGLPDDADITEADARWRYGMSLGAQFAPNGTLYDGSQTMPAVGADYQMNGAGSNTAFNQVNDRPHLHTLDAYLNTNRMSVRTGPTGAAQQDAGAYLTQIIASLTQFEKQLVLTDRMPDGNRYSTAFGALGVVVVSPFQRWYGADDTQVTAAMPSNGNAGDISAFMDRFHSAQSEHTVGLTGGYGF